jgi:glycosyltransferase involved in cell wall biosynthesis
VEERESPKAVSRHAVIRDGGAAAGDARDETARSRGDAAELVRVDDVSVEKLRDERWIQRLSGVATQPRHRGQDDQLETARLPKPRRSRSEGHEPAGDVGGKGSGELERIPFAAAEDARRAEESGGDVHDAETPIAVLTAGDTEALTGGHLYNRRIAEHAPDHSMRLAIVTVPPLPFPLQVLAGRRALARALWAAPAAILVDSLAAHAFALSLPAISLRPRLIGLAHQPPGGLDGSRPRRLAQRALDRAAYRRMDAFIATSEHLRSALIAAGLPAERISVVLPGSDIASGPERAGDLRRGRRIAVLCVANVLPRKGILDLIEAVAGLPGEAATLHLVGLLDRRTSYGRRVAERLEAADLRDRVVRHGPLAPDEVAAVYRAADVFALPSREEPFGMAYAEALRAGLPIVAYRSGNVPALVENGREGVLAEPGNVPALREALRRLAEDEELYGRMSEAARRRGALLPTWRETAARFFEVVRRLIGPRAGAAAASARPS